MPQSNCKKDLIDPIFPGVKEKYIEEVRNDYDKHAGECSEAGTSPKRFDFQFLAFNFNIHI
jgi:hypothetical protein